jgi:putative ABC transport system ATP-binding protein/macrolide transport system ATP-binding/permease protein/lipoprotein-releasing system ATP-binding protein
LLLADQAAGLWQQHEISRREELRARLDRLSTDGLRTGIDDIVFDGSRYILRLRLQNASRQPFYVLMPRLEGFVQVGPTWEPFPVRIAEGDAREGTVIKLEKEREIREIAEVTGSGYAEPLPGYRHVKLTLEALVSPEENPQEDIGERREEFFLFLRDVTRDAEFSGSSARRPSFVPLRAWTLLPKEAL